MRYKKLLKLINDRSITKRYAYLTLALFISAIAYNLFIVPINLVAGGASGIAVITQELFNIEPSIMVFSISFVLLIFCYIFLGEEETLGALFVTIVYPLFISITKDIGSIFYIDMSNKLLICIYAGIFGGLTDGMVYQVGINPGGIGILGKILQKYKKIPQTKARTLVNLIIVSTGAFTFGINSVLFAAVYLYIDQLVSERLLLGISQNKVFYIVTKKYQDIVKVLQEDLGHDATIYDTKGGWFRIENKMIMTVIPNKDHFIVKEYVKALDKRAFIFITDNYEVRRQDTKIKSVNL